MKRVKKATSKVISLYVDPLYAVPSNKTIKLGDRTITLRDFQVRLYEELSRGSRERLGIFLRAPTGAGKTYVALILLAIREYRGVVCVYPTKTLAKDQYDTIYNVLESETKLPLKKVGIKRTIGKLIEDGEVKKLFEEKGLPRSERDFISLWEVTIKSLEGEKFKRKVLILLLTSETAEALKLLLDKQTKREAFLDLANNIFLNVDFVMIFTVPEYPYMLHEMSYGEFEKEGEKLWRIMEHYKRFLRMLSSSATSVEDYVGEIKEILNRYRREFGVTRDSLREILEIYAGLFRYPLFIDEFHLYSDLTEISLVALIFTYYAFYQHAKAIFSSATPKESLETIIKVLHRLFNVKTLVVEANTRGAGEREHLIRGRTRVNFYCVSTSATGLGGLLKAQRFVPEVVCEVVKREHNKKTMVILDRVALVFDTCEKIKATVGKGKELIQVTSIKIPTEYCKETNLESLKQGKYDYIIGNLAIAQGIDLKHVERSVIYAKDLMSFIQRFGRVPRGRDGEVNIVVDWSRIGKLKELKGRRLKYNDFIKILKKWKVFPKPVELSWFRHYIGFLKLTFPIFAHIVRSAIAYIDEEETKYDKLRNALPKLADFIREYFSTGNVLKKLQVDDKPMGSYLTFFRLMSFRDVPSIKVEAKSSKGKYERELSLLVSLRNFSVSCGVGREGVAFTIDVEKRGFYIPFFYYQEVYEDDEPELTEMLRPLDDKVLSFKSLLYILSNEYDFLLAQTDGKRIKGGSIRVRELLNRIEKTELADVPVLLKVKKPDDKDFEDYAIFMTCTRDALPIGIQKQYGIKVLGIAMLI